MPENRQNFQRHSILQKSHMLHLFLLVGAISESRQNIMIVGNPNQEINGMNTFWYSPKSTPHACWHLSGMNARMAFPGVPSYNIIKGETRQLNASAKISCKWVSFMIYYNL